MPKYGLNGSTTMPLDQTTEIRLAAAARFDLIEFRAPKIEAYLKKGSLSELKRLMGECGIQPLSINSIEQVNTRFRESCAELTAEAEKLANWAAELACPYVIAVPGFLDEPGGCGDLASVTVDALARLTEIMATHGVRLGFEFLGFADCSVNSLRHARGLVEQVRNPNLGLVVDSFHFFLSGEPVELLRDLGRGELFAFHVNDVEGIPKEKLGDEHRLLPGRGVAPLKKMWAALQAGGGVDHASLELFRPEYWNLSPEPFLRDARVSLAAVFA